MTRELMDQATVVRRPPHRGLILEATCCEIRALCPSGGVAAGQKAYPAAIGKFRRAAAYDGLAAGR